jgi:hypothetical protein
MSRQELDLQGGYTIRGGAGGIRLVFRNAFTGSMNASLLDLSKRLISREVREEGTASQ